MPLIIQKYGGKALATPEDILQVAKLIFDKKKSGLELVIVVSAMGDTTDRYIGMARAVNPAPQGRELDVLLSVGERISIAMLALALNALQSDIAVSLTGAQAGIITDTVHTAAKIVEIRATRVREILDQGKIPIIAGYQGITTDKNISTLGRGGTDATAVGLAIALHAERVEFMKDVDGVQTADPKLIPTAKIIERLSYEESLEMMGCGAKILQVPAVEMAAEHHMKLAIGNSKTGTTGTILTDRPLGRRTLTAIVLTENVHCCLCESTAEFLHMIKNLREQGHSPLLASQSGGKSLVVVRAEEAALLLPPSTHPITREPISLLTMVGPGVGGANELAEAVMRKLQPYQEIIAALNISESRVSVLLPAENAKAIATSVHDLCAREFSPTATAVHA